MVVLVISRLEVSSTSYMQMVIMILLQTPSSGQTCETKPCMAKSPTAEEEFSPTVMNIDDGTEDKLSPY